MEGKERTASVTSLGSVRSFRFWCVLEIDGFVGCGFFSYARQYNTDFATEHVAILCGLIGLGALQKVPTV